MTVINNHDDGQAFHEQIARQEEWEAANRAMAEAQAGWEEAARQDAALRALWAAQEVAMEEGAVYAAIAALEEAMQGKDKLLVYEMIQELLLKYNKIVVDL